MRLAIALLLAASVFGQQPAPAITDAQRIAYLIAENTLLRKQLAQRESALKGPEEAAVDKASASITTSCPGVQRLPGGDIVCPQPAPEVKQ